MNDLNHIIFKIIANEATSAEREQFENWIHEDAANELEFQKIKSYYESKVAYRHNINPEEAYERFRKKHLKATVLKPKRWFSIAAISTAAAVALLLITLAIPKDNQPDVYGFLTYESRDTLYLPDSTMVVLNKNSKINYTSEYANTERRVKLIGEGYFDVRKNKSVPFVVEMDKGQITVLGTVFNIRTYDADNFIKATLVSGSIQFNMPENSDQITLQPGQELNFNKKTDEISIRKVDVDKALLWLNEIYRYESTTLQYLLTDIGVINNMQVSIADNKLANMVISGSFRHDQPLTDILHTISLSVPMKWEIDKVNNKVYIIPK